MSLSEKPPETSKDDWLQKLESVHVQRSDMNRLIMNYLVTGTPSTSSFIKYLVWLEGNGVSMIQ